jgi:hypothetical protein
METHGRAEPWQQTSSAEAGHSHPGGNGWPAVEIEDRFNRWTKTAVQTEDDIRRVDGKAIGELTGAATDALYVGRHRGLEGDTGSRAGTKIDPELEEAYFQAALDDAIAFGSIKDVTRVASPERDEEINAYLDNDLEDPEPVTVADLPSMTAVEQVSALKQRPGDQALPDTNDEPYIQNLVIEDIKQRLDVGISRYGTGLQAFNNRDAVLDAYEEALDLAMYLKQVHIELQSITSEVAGLRRENEVLSHHVREGQDTIARVEHIVFTQPHVSARDTVNRLAKALRL